MDPSVDTFRSATLPLLKRFGVPSEGLDIKIESRGSPPHGGGEVVLTVPVVQSLKAVTWTDVGMVKRIRGVTFSTRVSSQFENTMIQAACGIFNNFIPDVHIFTDHKAGTQAGNSPGYGISLVAETNAGCFISADTAIAYAHEEETGAFEDEKKELMPPEDVGVQIASILLGEIEQGGVVDSTHQILVTGFFHEEFQHLWKSSVFCVCGDASVPAEAIQCGVYRCLVLPHSPGSVNLFMSFDGHKPISQVLNFEYRTYLLSDPVDSTEENYKWEEFQVQLRLASLLFSTFRSLNILSNKVSPKSMKEAKKFADKSSSILNDWACFSILNDWAVFGHLNSNFFSS